MQARKHAAAAVGWSVTDAGWCQVDNSSKPMSLKLIMEREKVDHMLATGQVSDTALAMADEKAAQAKHLKK